MARLIEFNGGKSTTSGNLSHPRVRFQSSTTLPGAGWDFPVLYFSTTFNYISDYYEHWINVLHVYHLRTFSRRCKLKKVISLEKRVVPVYIHWLVEHSRSCITCLFNLQICIEPFDKMSVHIIYCIASIDVNLYDDDDSIQRKGVSQRSRVLPLK